MTRNNREALSLALSLAIFCEEYSPIILEIGHMKRRLSDLDNQRVEAFRAALAKEPPNPTIRVSREWMLGLCVTAENFGVPVEKLVGFLLSVGSRCTRNIPITLFTAWENSSGFLAIENLYSDRGVSLWRVPRTKPLRSA